MAGSPRKVMGMDRRSVVLEPVEYSCIYSVFSNDRWRPQMVWDYRDVCRRYFI